MPEDNIKANIGGLEQNVDVPERYLVSAAVAGAQLTVNINKGSNITGEWQLEPDETPTPSDVVIDNPNQVLYSQSNFDISQVGNPIYVPLILTNTNSNRPNIRTGQTVEDKVNQYYNDVDVIYLDNGQQKQVKLYAPDDSASMIIDNYSPGFYSFNTPSELSEFLSDYNQVIGEPTLEKRMSHYNLEWENLNQTILDALNNTNGLEMQQIIWNVYDFSGGDKPKTLEYKLK